MMTRLMWQFTMAVVFGAGLAGAARTSADTPAGTVNHLQGEIAGEPTETSVILQSRLTAAELNDKGDAPGRAGVACFEIADNPEMNNAQRTKWLRADPEHDFIIKVKVPNLKPQTRYHYRLVFGPDEKHTDEKNTRTGPIRSFRTLAGNRPAEVKFAVVTGMNYAWFRYGPGGDERRAATGDDRKLGFPAFVAIGRLKPDFFISTGDSVYYDIPLRGGAITPDAMRRKWRELFLQPRAVNLFGSTATYWEKDDHDTRFDDCDATSERKPSLLDGIRIFNEQTPVVDPAEPAPVTYRTHRVCKDAQIWLLEGRDYRSPNSMPDGPEKSIWGTKQLEWLKKSLLESDATFKLLILPTPMVGPDGPVKRDNHVNLKGFRHERDSFFRWIKEQQLDKRGLLLVCGDRHWQYHAIDPSGIEEFSTGALVTNNARMGVKPGEKGSSDPEGKVKQQFTSPKPVGGFLLVTVTPAVEGKPATCQFDFCDETGAVLYTAKK